MTEQRKVSRAGTQKPAVHSLGQGARERKPPEQKQEKVTDANKRSPQRAKQQHAVPKNAKRSVRDSSADAQKSTQRASAMLAVGAPVVSATPLFASLSNGAGQALSQGWGGMVRSMEGLFGSDPSSKDVSGGSKEDPVPANVSVPGATSGEDKGRRRFSNVPPESLKTGIKDWDSPSHSAQDLKKNWKQQLAFLLQTEKELDGAPSSNEGTLPKEVVLGLRFLSSKHSIGSISKDVEGSLVDEKALAEVKKVLAEKMAHHLGASFVQLLKTSIPFHEFDEYQQGLAKYIPATPEIRPLSHVEQLNPDNVPNLMNTSMTNGDLVSALAEKHANFFAPRPMQNEMIHPYVYMQRANDADIFPIKRENAVLIGMGLQKGIISTQEANRLVDEERKRWTDPTFSSSRNHEVSFQALYKELYDTVRSQVEDILKKMSLEDNEAYQAGLSWWNERASYFTEFARKHLSTQARAPELKGKVNALDLFTAVDRILYPLLESRRQWSKKLDERLASLTQNESMAKKNQNLIRKLNDLKLAFDLDMFFIAQKRHFTQLNEDASKLLNPRSKIELILALLGAGRLWGRQPRLRSEANEHRRE